MPNYSWGNSPGVSVGGGIYVVPGSTGGTLSKNQLYALLRTAGFSDTGAQRMLAIAGRESEGTYRTNILSDPSEAATDYSVGLFQNNYISTAIGSGRAGWSSLDAAALASNPLAQAQAAFAGSSGGTVFSPWSTNAGLSAASLADAAQVAASTPESEWAMLVNQAQQIGGAGAPALQTGDAAASSAIASGAALVSAQSGASSSTTTSSAGGSQFTLIPGLTGPGGLNWPGVKISTGFLWSAGFFILAGLLIIAGLVLAFRRQLESGVVAAGKAAGV